MATFMKHHANMTYSSTSPFAQKQAFGGVAVVARKASLRRGSLPGSRLVAKRPVCKVSVSSSSTNPRAPIKVAKPRSIYGNFSARDSEREAEMDSRMILGRPVTWEAMFRFMDGKVTGTSPEECAKALAKGKVTLLDLRSPDDGASDIEWMNPGFFIAGTMRNGMIEKSVNVPLYSLIGGNTFYKQARRASFSYIFGVLNGQEIRTDFVDEVLALIPNKKTPLVLMCDSKYATMEKATGRDFGIRSRALQGAYYLLKVGGYTNVTFLEGGFLGWDKAGLPVQPFTDPNAQPFAQRNLPKMFSILFFLIVVTSIKTGAVFVPIIFFAPEGTLTEYGLGELEEVRNLYVNTFSNLLHLK
eukprot:CAMPEP_0198203836 /NCGR_PEP_ID=MMETSP1445-20131203/7172_1 /TAXON_ID=36898 /ORGANISM="Pyramimonas sp., Strain CCMP2087" /LENGTH=356 /DNA_ID=CAMNT_0043875399 /DNA_START=38 /DNA_END=1108 /DNA_ORIENTATION=+